MPTYPNYLSPASGYGTSSYYSGPSGYSPNMNDPQYDPNYYAGPKRGTMEDPQYQKQLQDREFNQFVNQQTQGAPQDLANYLGDAWSGMRAMGKVPGFGTGNPVGGGAGGSSSGGGGGGGSSAAAQAALDRRFQMDLERMKLAQMDAQNKWNARMQGFGSDLSLRNNLYGIAAQQPSSQQVGNALQIIGGDSARAFQPPVNPIGPAKGAMDYFPQGEQQQPPRAPAYTTWRR